MNKNRITRFIIVVLFSMFILMNMCLFASSLNTSFESTISENDLSNAELIDNNNSIYHDTNGNIIVNDWVNEGGEWYYVGPTGKKEINKWINSANDDWFYVGEDGKLQKSKWIDGKYYVNSDGKMLKNTTMSFMNKTYIFDNNGVCSEEQISIQENYTSTNVLNTIDNDIYIKSSNKELSKNDYFSNSYTENKNSMNNYVYVTEKGKKYHSNSRCSNMKKPSMISMSDAINQGYTKCKKCW